MSCVHQALLTDTGEHMTFARIVKKMSEGNVEN